MAHHYGIARPYAKALFEQAVADNQLQRWADVLHVLTLITQDSSVLARLTHPEWDSSAKIKLLSGLLYAVIKDLENTIKQQCQQLLILLTEHKRSALLPDIAALYNRLLADYQKTVNVDVISALALNDTQKQALKAALTKRFSSSIELHFSEDPELIGGIVLKSGNWVMDGSVTGQLDRLSDSIRG